MYLIDTDFLIDLSNSKSNAIKKASKIDEYPTYKAISTITVQELLRGIYYLYGEKMELLEVKLQKAEKVMVKFDILPVDYLIAKKAAEIDAYLTRKGKMIGWADVIIAATANQYGLSIITKNEKHYRVVPDIKIEPY